MIFLKANFEKSIVLSYDKKKDMTFVMSFFLKLDLRNGLVCADLVRANTKNSWKIFQNILT